MIKLGKGGVKQKVVNGGRECRLWMGKWKVRWLARIRMQQTASSGGAERGLPGVLKPPDVPFVTPVSDYTSTTTRVTANTTKMEQERGY